MHVLSTKLPGVLTKADGVVTILDNGDPDTPTNLTASTSPTTLGGVDLSWSAPSATGRPITGYQLRQSSDGVTFGAWVSTASGTNRYTTAACTPGATCYFQVRAANDNGTGGSTATASVWGRTTRPHRRTRCSARSTAATSTRRPRRCSRATPVLPTATAARCRQGLQGIGTGGSLVDTRVRPRILGHVHDQRLGAVRAGRLHSGRDPERLGGPTATSNSATFEVRNAVFVSARGNDADSGYGGRAEAHGRERAHDRREPEPGASRGRCRHVPSGSGIAPIVVGERARRLRLVQRLDSCRHRRQSGTPDNSQTLVTGAPQAALVNGAFDRHVRRPLARGPEHRSRRRVVGVRRACGQRRERHAEQRGCVGGRR